MVIMKFKPWEKMICNVRMIPKAIILMVFSTLLLVVKQLWDANVFYDVLLSITKNTDIAQNYYNDYIVAIVWQTLLIIAVFVVILLGAANIMLRQMKFISTAISKISDGDFSAQIDMESKDEFGDIAREIEKTRIKLKDLIALQRTNSQELTTLTEVMTMSMSETRESAQEEFQEIDKLATAMNQMVSTVHSVADHAQQASELTDDSAEKAQTGQEFVEKTIGTMSALSDDIAQSAGAVNQVEERVEAISSVVGTIQGISEQTNLLALNAAIEAARAGEAGRGFAVVADEVRNLAQNTQTATVEIQNMITQLQSSANSAVNLMEKSVVEAAEGVELITNAGSELGGIVEQVRQIREMNFQIATAANEQKTVAEEMGDNLTSVKELVEASVTVVTELLETSEIMQENAESLDKKINTFVV